MTYATLLPCGCWMVEQTLVRSIGCIQDGSEFDVEPASKPWAHPDTMIGRQ